MIKRLMFLSVIMSAAGVPYLLSTSADWWTSIKSRFAGSGEAAATAPVTPADMPAVQQASRSFGAIPQMAQASKAPVEGYGRYQLAEVLQFECTPAWVMSRWPRVTSGLAEPDLQGYRVPLVTGTGESDLAGSLTYYFDEQQRAKLIHFRGTTGNPQQLVAYVTNRFGMKPQPTVDPGLQLFQLKWNGKPVSELRIRTAQIVRAAQPYSRFQVELAIKQQ